MRTPNGSYPTRRASNYSCRSEFATPPNTGMQTGFSPNWNLLAEEQGRTGPWGRRAVEAINSPQSVLLHWRFLSHSWFPWFSVYFEELFKSERGEGSCRFGEWNICQSDSPSARNSPPWRCISCHVVITNYGSDPTRPHYFKCTHHQLNYHISRSISNSLLMGCTKSNVILNH